MADEVVETLKLIWQEMKALNSKADRTNERLESLERSTGARFESLERSTGARFESLERSTEAHFESLEGEIRGMGSRIAESEMRVATEVVALRGAFVDMRDKLSVVIRQDHRIQSLEERVAAVERKTG